MKPTTRRQTMQTLASSFALLGAPQAWAQASSEPTLAKTLRERVALEGVGMSAALIDGTSVQFFAAGVHRAGQPQPVDADTLYELGSVTKTFTALLLADMVVRGELKLDDAVEAVLPQDLKLRDSTGARITWADLATHRSGLPRLPSNLRDPSGPDPYDYSRADMWSFLAQWKPGRARDAQWEYSNLGYGLLGEALALRAGSSYAALLSERVLKPLGLTDMRVALRDVVVPGLTQGHNAEQQAVPHWRFDAIAAAAALVGSARSLARYAQAALGTFDHPLKEAFQLALTPRAAGPTAANPIGLAWLAVPRKDRRVLYHNGGTAGFSTSLFLNPAHKRASLALANALGDVNDLALHLLDPAAPLRDIAAERRHASIKTVTVPPEALVVLPGIYALNAQFKVTIRQHEGQLFAQATGQSEFQIFAIDARKWLAKVTPLEIHFEGESGTPPAMVLHQGGQKLRFVRE